MPKLPEKRGRKPKDGVLSVREQQFIRAWLCESCTLGEAYLKINPKADKKNRDLANSEGYRLKERIKAKIGYSKMMEYGGLGEETLIKKHRALLDAKRVVYATDGGKITDVKVFDDPTTQMAALKHANELHGHVIAKSSVDVAVRPGRQHWTDVLRDAEDALELPEGESEDES